MEPTLKTPVETQGERTNLETYGASKSHTVTNTVPTVSENETMDGAVAITITLILWYGAVAITITLIL